MAGRLVMGWMARGLEEGGREDMIGCTRVLTGETGGVDEDE